MTRLAVAGFLFAILGFASLPSGAHALNHESPTASGGSSSVPELDPAGAASALTLLAGGILMLTGRRRRNGS